MSETTSTIQEITTPPPGTGHVGQTFLVGEHVYVRAIEIQDAKYGQSWTKSIFPRATTRYEKWIKEELPKEKRSNTYIILRKADDVPVGSIRTWKYEPTTYLSVHVDPLYGERGKTWLAEALRLTIPWFVDEQQRPRIALRLASDEHQVIEALHAIGARQTARFREMLRTWGGRVDALDFEYLNRDWVERLGDPAEIEFPRSGIGEARPVPERVTVTGNLPANAVQIGQRVYLRPLTKDDATLAARLSRQDTETFWDAGRYVFTAPQYQHWIEDQQKAEPARHVRFAICLRETDETIGSLGIDSVDYTHGYAESESHILRPEYRGGGYGSEAKHLLFDYAFNTLKLHTLISTVIFPNTRSAAALRKQGYKEAGRMHWIFPSSGKFENFVGFDLLASDWRAMPRTTNNEERS